jgi:D-alanyl-D-alanine carboxypeptidase (penicillin-binding protein 5/6)
LEFVREEQPPDEQSIIDNGQLIIDDEPDEPETPEDNIETVRFGALFGSPETNAATAINAPFGALYNLTDDVFIYGKRVDERIYPGGAARLLTALVVYNALETDFIFTVGTEIGMIQQGSGTAGLISGQRLSMEAMLSALLIPIGIDAAYTVSINTARELTDASDDGDRVLNDKFLRMMNDYIQGLGAENSNFANPCGFHANDNYSTVRDLTILAAAAAENPMIALLCGKSEHEVAIASGGRETWTNSNALLSLEHWDIRGLRTGYTDESMFSAQILAYIDGKLYITVVSGSQTPAERENDVIRLLQMARDGYNADIINVFEG